MSVSGVVIVVVVIGLLISSIMWVSPSPREKKLAALRRKAMVLGMQVRLANLAAAGARSPALPGVQPGQGVAYILRRERNGGSAGARRWSAWRDEDAAGSWHFEGNGAGQPGAVAQKVLAAAARFPAEVYRLESTPGEIMAYWTERGDDALVQAIYDALSGLKEDAG